MQSLWIKKKPQGKLLWSKLFWSNIAHDNIRSTQFRRPVVDAEFIWACAILAQHVVANTPFPSSFLPLFKNMWKPFYLKMSLICLKMNMLADRIFMWMVSYVDSFWHRGNTRKWAVANWVFKVIEVDSGLGFKRMSKVPVNNWIQNVLFSYWYYNTAFQRKIGF